jgi:hypothetical protein
MQHHLVHALGWVTASVVRRLQAGKRVAVTALADGEQQVFLRWVVDVDRGWAATGPRGDVPGTGPAEAVIREHVNGSVEQALLSRCESDGNPSRRWMPLNAAI